MYFLLNPFTLSYNMLLLYWHFALHHASTDANLGGTRASESQSTLLSLSLKQVVCSDPLAAKCVPLELK